MHFKMRLLSTCLLVIALAASLPAILAAAGKDKPMQEWDGLVRRPSNKLDNVWVRPNVRFKEYKRVRLPPVDVAFAKDWDPNRGTRSPTNEDIRNIRAGMSQLFHEEFAQRLTRRGYTLTDSNADDVLIVQAALANLYINGPQSSNADVAHAFTMSPGRVSVVMQLSDSVTLQLLARVVDTQEGDEYGNLTWSSSVSSSTEARRIFGIWADALCRGLDKLSKGQ
jgi:hypothetical protein